MFTSFRPEPYSDFSDPAAADAFSEALRVVEKGMGGHRPLVIGGGEVDPGGRIESLDPSRPDRVVGTVAAAADYPAMDAHRGCSASRR